MSQQQAMGAYVDLLTQLDPSWAALGPSTSGKAGHGKQQSMGPVFSTMAADPSCTYQQVLNVYILMTGACRPNSRCCLWTYQHGSAPGMLCIHKAAAA